MRLLGVARANTAVGVSPETFLLLLLQKHMPHKQTSRCKDALYSWAIALSKEACPDYVRSQGINVRRKEANLRQQNSN
jgi:hypothetical protein